MAFTNTVETVGDAALTRSIIDRSITELNCNLTTSIRQQAFRACTALASVNFPSVTSVALGAFWQCTALTKADFASAVAFANNAFYGCSALTALILRNTEQVSTITGTPFAASAIASGTGYIYVPAALVDTYKAASGWSTYASQIRAIEDYVEVIDPYSWAAVAKMINNGTHATFYKVGDTVPLDLGSEGLVNMEIVGIDVDDLADGSGKAPISWISKELLKTRHRMNPGSATNADGTYQEGTGAIGGWEKCEMRTYIQDTIYPLISSDVQMLIKPVTKYSQTRDTGGNLAGSVETVDSIWIPSAREVGGTSWEQVGVRYSDMFPDQQSRKKEGTSWWTRTANSTNISNFTRIEYSGYIGYDSCTTEFKIALGFCT